MTEKDVNDVWLKKTANEIKEKMRFDFPEVEIKLEHGHIDYNYPEIYLTVCHECNYWMQVTKEDLQN